MLPDPYTPSDRPRIFVGRDRARRLLRDKLARGRPRFTIPRFEQFVLEQSLTGGER